MKILFLGDVVGSSGCRKITNDLSSQIKKNKIDFVIINGENADDTGVGLTKEICKDFFSNLRFVHKILLRYFIYICFFYKI